MENDSGGSSLVIHGMPTHGRESADPADGSRYTAKSPEHKQLSPTLVMLGEGTDDSEETELIQYLTHDEEDLFSPFVFISEDVFDETSKARVETDAIPGSVDEHMQELRLHRRRVELLLARQLELLRSCSARIDYGASSCGTVDSDREDSPELDSKKPWRPTGVTFLVPEKAESGGMLTPSAIRTNRQEEEMEGWRFASAFMNNQFADVDEEERLGLSRTKSERRLQFASYRSNSMRQVHPAMRHSRQLVGNVNSMFTNMTTQRCTSVQRERMTQIVNNRTFTLTITCIILLNAAFTGYVVDFEMRGALITHDNSDDGLGHETPLWQEVVEIFFVVVFSLELFMRMFADGLKFFNGKDFTWNMMDMILVATSLVEVGLPDAGINLTFLRVERLLKMTRAFRILKVVRHLVIFRQLRILLLASLNCLIFMFWAMVVLLVVIFLFAILFLMGISSYVSDSSMGDTTVESFRVFFHSLPMAMLTLWMSCSGGVDWWDVEILLLKMPWPWCVLFAFFQGLMLLGMLNIVTGFVVQDAIEAMNADKDLQASLKDERTDRLVQRLTGLFHRMDSQGSGVVRREDFIKFMRDRDAQGLMAELDINVSDFVLLFDILDVDENGDVEIDEFVMGAMQLKVHADLLNMALLMHKNNRLLQKSFKMIHAVGKSVCVLGDQMERTAASAEPVRSWRPSSASMQSISSVLD